MTQVLHRPGSLLSRLPFDLVYVVLVIACEKHPLPINLQNGQDAVKNLRQRLLTSRSLKTASRPLVFLHVACGTPASGSWEVGKDAGACTVLCPLFAVASHTPKMSQPPVVLVSIHPAAIASIEKPHWMVSVWPIQRVFPNR